MGTPDGRRDDRSNMAASDGRRDDHSNMGTSDGWVDDRSYHLGAGGGRPNETGSPSHLGGVYSKNGDTQSSQADDHGTGHQSDDRRYPADGHPSPVSGSSSKRLVSRQSPVGSDSHLSPARARAGEQLSKENSLDLPNPSGQYRAKAGSLTALTIPPITGGFTVLRSAESDEEIGSLYSEPCYDSDLETLGSVKLAVWYRNEEAILYVRIHSASDLASTKGKEVNPYVKVHLLPDQSKHTKRKTGILRNTKNPEFDETVKVGTQLALYVVYHKIPSDHLITVLSIVQFPKYT